MTRQPADSTKQKSRYRSSSVMLAGVLLALIGLAVVAYLALGGSDEEPPGGLVFVIPAGASETVEIPTINSVLAVPTHIVFASDEVAAITIRNDDTVANRAGPWVVGPGQSYSIRFENPGEYFFNCAVDPLESVTVIVEEP